MKLEDGRISMLVSGDKTTIEIRDNKANVTFCKIVLTPIQLSQMLSRLSQTQCEIEIFGLDRIGKNHQNKRFEFEIPKKLRSSSKSKELVELCNKCLAEYMMSDWTPDTSFASQDSFFEKDGKTYARAVIRRWT